MTDQIAIELNDSGIIVSDGQQLLLESPGYIINLEGQEWLGKDARDRAFLHPNDCHHRFWSDLARTQENAVNQDNAKLTLRHLAFIWDQVSANVQTVILTVPGTYTKTGLGLLLGICKELSIPVRAMIHHAALSPRQSEHSGATIHIDVQLHHTAITQLHEHQDEFRAGQTQVLDDVGFMSIYTAAAEFIAQRFISTTRLDPMHTAELEQQLYNNLPTWLEISRTRDLVRCQLEHQNSLFEVAIDSDDLIKTLNPGLNKIVKVLSSLELQQPVIACASEAINKQFGFNQLANNQGIMVRPLHFGYHAKQSLLHAKQLLHTDSQIYLNKQLPYTTLTDTLPMVASAQAKAIEPPTHILYRNHAFPLTDILYLAGEINTGFQLQNAKPDPQQELLSIRNDESALVIEIVNGQEITVNDQVVQSYTGPSVGDCIRIASNSDELIFIKVEN